MELLENKNNIDASTIIRATPYARPFWEYHKIYPNGTDYNISFIQDISGDLDIRKLENAFKRMLSEIVVMGCNLKERDNELFWVYGAYDNNFIIKCLNSEADVSEFSLKPIDIEKECLVRVAVYIENNTHYRLILVLHHLLLDGGSVTALLEQINKYYNNIDYHYPIDISSQIANLNDLNYAVLKRIGMIKNPEKYSQILLNNAASNITISHLSDDKLSNSIKELYFEVGDDLMEKINVFMHSENTSQFKVLLSAWYVFLCRYFNCESIVINFPVAIKEGSALHYGCSINSVLLSMSIDNNDTFLCFFKKINSLISEIKEGDYWALPINEALKYSNIKKLSFSIAQTSFKDENLKLDALDCVSNNSISTDIGLSDLLLLLDINNPKRLCLKYRVSMIDAGYAEILQNYFIAFLDDLLTLKEQRVLNIKIGSSGFLKNTRFNRVDLEQRFIDVLDEKMKPYGSNRALIFKDTTITYSQLNELSNQFSHDLIGVIGQFDSILSPVIPLMMSRGIEMIVAMLGLLKLGFGYLPIEPSIPEERLKYIIDEVNPLVIITQEQFQNRLITYNSYVLNLEKIKLLNRTNPNTIVKNNITYMMYTSGTTGNPKGIKISNGCAINRIQQMSDIIGLKRHDVYLFKTSYAFDVSFSDIFVALFSGASLVITEKLFDPDEIQYLIKKHAITSAHFVPSQYRAIKDKIYEVSNLRKISFSGETLLSTDLNAVDLKKTRIINFYGPTETGECTYHEVTNANYIPIGKCINGFSAVVMDHWQNLSPVGSVGTLFMAGSFVSDMYVNVSDSSNKIIINPYAEINYSKYLYSTGDLVRINKYGDIEYIGRQESMVKVNGYRVEFDEIKSIILKYNDVKDAHIEVESVNGLSQIVCYIVASDGISLVALRAFILKYLPYYCAPSRFYLVDKFDLNNNGKLINNNKTNSYSAKMDVGYRNELEKEICFFCSSKVNFTVSSACNVFDLGFSSINIVELVSFIENKFKYSFPIELLYKYPVISDFSDEIRSYRCGEVISINNENMEDVIAFFHTTNGGNEVYYPLAKLLQLRSVGLNPYDFSTSHTLDNLDLICEKYCDALKKSGYLENIKYLCGWSFGGLLAYKTAVMLSKELNIKPLVILIDTVTPNFYSALLGGIDESRHYNLLGSDEVLFNANSSHDILMKELQKKSIAYKKMIPSCKLESYCGDVVLIKAKQPVEVIRLSRMALSLFESSEDYGWQKYIKGKFVIQSSDADHQSILYDNPQNIAEIISKFIVKDSVDMS